MAAISSNSLGIRKMFYRNREQANFFGSTFEIAALRGCISGLWNTTRVLYHALFLKNTLCSNWTAKILALWQSTACTFSMRTRLKFTETLNVACWMAEELCCWLIPPSIRNKATADNIHSSVQPEPNLSCILHMNFQRCFWLILSINDVPVLKQMLFTFKNIYINSAGGKALGLGKYCS